MTLNTGFSIVNCAAAEEGLTYRMKYRLNEENALRFALFHLLTLLSLFGPAVLASAAVNVTNGSLGLQLSNGATNDVWANPPALNSVFDRWVGDAHLLANPYAWHTTLVMPQDASLTATFKPAPDWSTTNHTLNGLAPSDPNAVNLIYYFPANPAGVIFFFNGARARASGFFTEAESFTFARDAVAAGYAVASLDSGGGLGKSWDITFSSSNLDVGNVRASLNYFISLGLMTTNTPKFATGMSAGGFFAPIPAYYLQFNACALWCSSGAPRSTGATVFNFTTVPTIWNLARNDDLYNHKAFLADATTNLALLAGRGVAGELRENQPSPVYPQRFTRIDGLTAADSQNIHDQLKAAGLLDAVDFLISSPFNNSNHWLGALPGYAPYTNAIQNQLNSCYSEHHFFSDLGNQTLQFFGARRPPVPGHVEVVTITRQPGVTVKLTIAAAPGQSYRVQASDGLRTWTDIFTNTDAGGTFDFTDANSPAMTSRFYRAISP